MNGGALEWVLRLHAGAASLCVPLLLRLLGLRGTLHLLDGLARLGRPYASLPPRRICAVVRRRLAHPRIMVRRACLRRGLLLYHLLRLAGLDARLRFAVYPPSLDPRRLHAHCWVSLGGRCLAPPADVPAATVLVWPN